MSDEPRGSMFDYDARPVTPQVVLVGHPGVHRSATNSVTFSAAMACHTTGSTSTMRIASRLLLDGGEIDPDQLPICVLPDGRRLAAATVEQVASGLGMVAAPLLSEYDLTIVGAGPAGLAAAVYAASEGLRAVAIEAVAPGGQAGTTSMIENYLGFPQGISGSELATRATAQARRFGAELLLARPLVDIAQATAMAIVARLSDGTRCDPVHARRRAASTGVASTSTGSTSSWARASTTARARVRRCRAAGAASRSSAAETPRAKPSCASRATRHT